MPAIECIGGGRAGDSVRSTIRRLQILELDFQTPVPTTGEQNRLYAGVGAFDLMQPAFVQCAFVGDMVKNRNIRIHHQSGKCTYGNVIEESSLRLPYHDRQG